MITWDVRDPAARRAKVACAFTLDASYLDPMLRGDGHTGIDAMIGAAQGHFPGMQFVLDGTPDGHNDVVRFSWSLGAPGAGPVARGTDVATVSADGRLVKVTGFLNAMPEAQAGAR